jgi:hypothetical protein
MSELDVAIVLIVVLVMMAALAFIVTGIPT